MKQTALVLIFIIGFLSADEIVPITLDHAFTEESRARGLMGRESLATDHGMTFNYSKPQYISIWMYQVLIDLSVAFLDDKKIIQEIHEMKAYPNVRNKNFFRNKSIRSSFKASYALEMNKNWFKDHNITAGDKAVWDINQQNGYIIKKSGRDGS